MPSPAPPPARQRVSSETRRELILAAAKGVFGSAGYHEATTRDIASAAGVSEALLYQHFPGKRLLFEELIGLAAADLERRLLGARSAANRPEAGVAAFFDFVESESELYRVFFRQALQADPAFRQLYVDVARRLVQLLEEGVPLTEVTARALAGMVTELALWWVEERTLDKREIVTRAGRMARAICDTEVGDATQNRA